MVSVVQIARGSHDQPVAKQLIVVLTDDNPELLPTLEIVADDHDADRYDLEEVSVGVPFDGRGFILHRTPEAVAKDGADADESYQTFVGRNGQDHSCTCAGHGHGGYCNHVDSLRQLIADGHLTEIGADAPPQEFPSADQVTLDSMLEAPF